MESIGQIQDCFLVCAVQGGNQAAFGQLVHAHDQAVLRLAFRITGSYSDAQDIYQEAFLKVYSKLGSFRFECSLFVLDLPYRHQPRLGSPAEESTA
jgi:RNA polymerase sigma-70 factor, ECF subfamily